MWIETFDAVFFISVATLMVGLLKYSFDKCFQSKCESFNFCCGFFEVKRRVDLEIQSEIRALELNHDETQHIRRDSQPPEVSTV